MKLLDKAIWYAFVTLFSMIGSTVTYRILAPVAYAQRGYFAVGGEVLLTLAVGFFIAIIMIRNKKHIIEKVKMIRRNLK